MSAEFEVIAEARSEEGKGASRRLRSAGKVPAIIYGGGKDPENISLIHKDVMKSLENEAFYSHIITVDVAGKKQKAVIKDIQRHPFKQLIMHMDFQRVSDKDKIRMHVPLHFINEDICEGVKTDGGVISHNLSDVEVMCQAKNLPEFIEVDLAKVRAGDVLHLSDLALPNGVELVELSHGESHDQPVAGVHARSAAVEEEVEAAAEESSEGEASEE